MVPRNFGGQKIITKNNGIFNSKKLSKIFLLLPAKKTAKNNGIFGGSRVT
jgi:hypothetical protein